MYKRQPYIIKNGKLLDLQLSLKIQGIVDGDKLSIYEPKSTSSEMDQPQITSFADKIKGLMNEAIRLNDNAMSRLESQTKLYRTIQSLALSIPEEDEYSEYDRMFNKTIIPTKSDKPSTEAIPIKFTQYPSYPEFDDNEMSDLGLSSMFETIEQAGKYFSKHSVTEWAW